MTSEKLNELILQGECIEVEFKTSRFELNKDTFETICAFLNRKGGHLLLGVKDNGNVEGILESSLQNIINNIVTNANNPQKLNPPFYLSPYICDYKDKKVIYIYIPESSQVHNTSGKIFDRNDNGDFEITKHHDQVTQLYLRKQSTYTENRVFPYVEMADFNPELFKRIRTIAENLYAQHPWLEMKDKDLLRYSGFYKKDPVTGKAGYTLAGILLLGKDETIIDVLPHHRTDAILRIENIDRYDDRDDIRTNLIESYDRLMAFIQKHLPDKFYQENTQRISLRDRLFREVVSNLLIHREFSNAFPAKLIIEKDKLYTENWNRPHGSGAIDPTNFSPYPKNPVIARFFKEIGRVDELGSGIRNTFKFCSIYTPGTQPEFIEGDIFKTIIPLKAEKLKTIGGWAEIRKHLGDQLGDRLGDRLGDSEWQILEIIWNNPAASITEMAASIKISTTAIEKNIQKLKRKGILERVGSTKKGFWKIKGV